MSYILAKIGSLFVGLSDLVPAAILAFGVRAYTNAAAAANVKAVNIRPGSGAANYDVNLLTNGSLDIATAIATAGVDTTGTGAITGTTLTFTGGHIGDTVTGGTTAAGTFIVSGSSPTWTVNKSQTVLSAALTLTWGMFIATLYNQNIALGSGNATQATNANQPLLVPKAGPNGIVPAMWFNGTSSALNTGSFYAPLTLSWVGLSNNGAASVGPVFAGSGTSGGHYNNGNVYLFQGTLVDVAATNGVWHSAAGVYNGAASIINVDGTNTTVNPGTGASNAGQVGANVASSQFFNGYLEEVVMWNSVTQTGAQLIAGNTNKHAYYGF